MVYGTPYHSSTELSSSIEYLFGELDIWGCDANDSFCGTIMQAAKYLFAQMILVLSIWES